MAFADREKIRALAAKAHMSMSDYVTACCLGKRIVVIDTTGEDPYVLINPEILETSGSQTGQEGCLSLPGKAGIVTRPDHVKVKALDENMEEFVLEGDGLLARAICHECDHLDGLMYVSKVEGELMDVEPIEEEEEELE